MKMKITLEINNKAINAFKKAFDNIAKPCIKKAKKAYKKANIAKICDKCRDKFNKAHKASESAFNTIKNNIHLTVEK